MCGSQLCKAVLTTQIPKVVQGHGAKGQVGRAILDSPVPSDFASWHASGLCGFSSHNTHTSKAAMESWCAEPTAGVRVHSSNGTSVEPSPWLEQDSLAPSSHRTEWSVGLVPSSLIVIEFDTEMPVERKECAGLAAPFPRCSTSARFGFSQPWGMVLL